MLSRTQTIAHPQFGTVQFRKVPRARSMKILVRPDRGVLVTLPPHETFAAAEAFLAQHAAWVGDTLQRVQARHREQQTVFTPETVFGTFSRRLQLVPEVRDNVRVQLTPEVVYIYYPQHRQVRDAVLQGVIRKALEHAWKVEAHEVLPARLAALAAGHGLSCRQLLIKNTRSYWGQCAPDNTITLNVHLMHLPPPLIDFVILHELAHTVHKNHGAAFHALLDSLCRGNARALARELRGYSTRVY